MPGTAKSGVVQIARQSGTLKHTAALGGYYFWKLFMNQKKLILSVLLLSLLQAGCTTFKSPENSSTQVTFKMAEDIAANANQFYYIYPEAECNKSEGFGKAASMMKMWGLGGSDSTVNVVAGEKLYILSELKTHTGGTTVYTHGCRDLISFTPENNQHYSVQQNNKCTSVSVINQNQADSLVNAEDLKLPYSCSYRANKNL